MGKSWQVGRLFGIPFFLDSSWFVVVVLFTVLNGSDWQRDYPAWGAWAWVAGFAMAILLFTSVLLHELGHSLVARSQGIQVNRITLFLFGGIAAIERESSTPGQAFQVAIAGPLVSFALAAILFGLTLVFPADTPGQVLANNLSGINLVLGIFNLLPGLPLDGGQVLKAAVWKVTGNRFQGVHWAARSGQILGWTGIILGAASVAFLGVGNGLWLALLGWFGIRNASLYDRMTNIQESLLTITANQAWSRDFRVVDATMPLREFAERYLLLEDKQPTAYFSASEGRYRGQVNPSLLSTIERSQWDHLTVMALTTALSDVPTCHESSSLAEIIVKLETQACRYLTVLSPAGAVAGVIDRGDIFQALAQSLNWVVLAPDLKQIKQSHQYPPGLQLLKLAETALQNQAPTTLADPTPISEPPLTKV